MSILGSISHRAAKRAENLLYRMGGLSITLHALGPGTGNEAQIRRAYARRYWRIERLGQLLEIACAALFWPVAVVLGSLYLTARNGPTVKRRCGRALPRQWIDQLRFAWTRGIMPPWYYIFALHDGDRAPYAATFLNRCETKRGVFPALREPEDRTIEFDDKGLFARLCRQHFLPAVPVIVVAEGGELYWQDMTALPKTDLFVKPLDGCGGKGAERWDYLSGIYYREGAKLTPAQWIDRLTRRSRDRALIAQPRVTNHPEMRVLSNGALSTMRLLTCLDERGAPEIMGAVCRMAIGDNRTVDNLHAGGIASRIALGDGQLSKATDLGLSARTGWLDVHPDTHAIITGRTIPHWDAVRALALRAHAAFAHHILVGWDIALLEDGPCLIEGNGGPDVDIMQRHSRKGLMGERFGALLAWHLAHAPARHPAGAPSGVALGTG
jgi:Sugar-transfer associated ATP-grasp